MPVFSKEPKMMGQRMKPEGAEDPLVRNTRETRLAAKRED